MEEFLRTYAQYVAWGTEAIAITCIAVGALEAIAGMIPAAFRRHMDGIARRAVWLKLARWLVAALTFQLAADIVGTTSAPTWQEVGRLGAIAVIRTFLSYFLDREVDSTRQLQHATPEAPPAPRS
jgi:uncharacterized membrane protein